MPTSIPKIRTIVSDEMLIGFNHSQLAGVCALLLQKDPSLTPSDIKQMIRRTSREVINGQGNLSSSEGVAVKASACGDGATGTGLVDAFAAFQQLLGVDVCCRFQTCPEMNSFPALGPSSISCKPTVSSWLHRPV